MRHFFHKRTLNTGWVPEILVGICLLAAAGSLPAQTGQNQTVDKYLKEIEQGHVAQAQSALPGLLQRYPHDPGVRYLQGMLETNGDKAFEIFKGIADQDRYNAYRDDAILKVGEYLYAKGLYLSAEKYLQQIPVHFPRSPHMEQAANLLVHSMAAAGKTDSSRTMARVLQREYPNITIAMGPEKIGSGSATSSEDQSEQAAASAPKPVDLTQDNPYYNPADSDAQGAAGDAPARYALQVGAFSTLKNANAGKEIFEEHNYPVQVKKSSRNGTELYLVWVGDYDTRQEAEKVGEDIRKKLALPFFIVETRD